MYLIKIDIIEKMKINRIKSANIIKDNILSGKWKPFEFTKEFSKQVNGWIDYSKYVNKSNIDIENKLTQIQVDIATLKVKAGIWGGIAGLVPVVLGLVLFFVTQAN